MQPTQSSATHPHAFDQLVCLRVRACPAEGFSDGLTTDFYTHTHTHTRLMALCPGLPG